MNHKENKKLFFTEKLMNLYFYCHIDRFALCLNKTFQIRFFGTEWKNPDKNNIFLLRKLKTFVQKLYFLVKTRKNLDPVSELRTKELESETDKSLSIRLLFCPSILKSVKINRIWVYSTFLGLAFDSSLTWKKQWHFSV